ncbi:hypothetical protein [Lacinutrix chionoecetis]
MSKTNKPFGLGKLHEVNMKAVQAAAKAAEAKAKAKAGKNAIHEHKIDAFSLKMLGADFKIDHTPRRKNQTPHRRALVHDSKDGLTINWAKDYPGGVTINGTVKCPNTLEIAGQDVLAILKTMRLKIEALEQKVEDLSWNTER